MATEVLHAGAFDSDAIGTQRRRVGWSAFLGTVIEYYDFTLYGLLGPVVFDKIFFPKTDPMVATLGFSDGGTATTSTVSAQASGVNAVLGGGPSITEFSWKHKKNC